MDWTFSSPQAWIGLLFLAPLLVAGLWDVVCFRIPNALTLGMAALFLPAALMAPVEVSWMPHVAAGTLVFAVGAGLFALGMLGGGDVKLLAAATLWLGLGNLPLFLVMVSVGGGVLTMAVLALRNDVVRGAFARLGLQPAVLRSREGIPYGIAIAAAGWMLVDTLPLLGG